MRYFAVVAYLSVATYISPVTAGQLEDYFRAVEVDAVAVVKELLDAGLDPNTRDDKGNVGLYLALRAGSEQAVAALLARKNLDVDAVNAVGETPVMMAALKGQDAIVRQLLERGAQLNREGWSVLHYAASGPSTRLVGELLDRGARIDAPSPNGTTALMMAARYGAIDSAVLLAARGADLRLRNQRGLNAADFAAGAGRDALAAQLQPK